MVRRRPARRCHRRLGASPAVRRLGAAAVITLSARRSARTPGGAVEQQRALALVSGQRSRAVELLIGLLEAIELGQQVTAHAWQERVALERALGSERIDERQRRR